MGMSTQPNSLDSSFGGWVVDQVSTKIYCVPLHETTRHDKEWSGFLFFPFSFKPQLPSLWVVMVRKSLAMIRSLVACGMSHSYLGAMLSILKQISWITFGLAPLFSFKLPTWRLSSTYITIPWRSAASLKWPRWSAMLISFLRLLTRFMYGPSGYGSGSTAGSFAPASSSESTCSAFSSVSWPTPTPWFCCRTVFFLAWLQVVQNFQSRTLELALAGGRAGYLRWWHQVKNAWAANYSSTTSKWCCKCWNKPKNAIRHGGFNSLWFGGNGRLCKAVRIVSWAKETHVYSGERQPLSLEDNGTTEIPSSWPSQNHQNENSSQCQNRAKGKCFILERIGLLKLALVCIDSIIVPHHSKHTSWPRAQHHQNPWHIRRQQSEAFWTFMSCCLLFCFCLSHRVGTFIFTHTKFMQQDLDALCWQRFCAYVWNIPNCRDLYQHCLTALNKVLNPQ